MMSITARVIRGDRKGSQLGFPTANLDCERKKINLPAGVYAGRAEVRDTVYVAAIAIQDQPEKVEVYLLDFEGGDLYGERLQVEIGEKVSEMEKISDEEKLRKKIREDIAAVR